MSEPVFNHIIVTSAGDNVVCAEAVEPGCTERLTQRLTIALPLTLEQAQRIADAVLARREGYDGPGISDDEILTLVA